MFSFFRRHSSIPFGYADLGVDMHSHILPGIDDGAPDVASAVKLVKGLVDLGYHKLIATPHIMMDLHPNTPATIRTAMDELRAAVAVAGIKVELEAAAEYMLDENFASLLNANEYLLTLDGRTVLIEFPQAGAPPNWEETFFTLQTKGYRIVLAHPERYRYWAGDINVYQRMRDKSVQLQLNLLSLSGYYGKGPARWGKELLDQNLASYLGTDLHHERHLHALAKFPWQKNWTKNTSRDWNNVQLRSLKN
ncbi:tyrosine-protein phosphatase [Neolewinella litorea]|uniref:protein-tyrosine-phosphatase n=1 Tax=Neolewinella litorea TaxID=2562452 RepID=A0A4S4NIF2_9BACT|nr:CpsB/CapC family capsule biosynthesis tyrosine phosphatase [Neolewinella litorea]THH39512.1 hypothetical protein E4021_12240 [Neolewinella litorea]